MNKLFPLLVAAIVAAMASAPSTAQPYPNRPIRVVNPTAAGGQTDTMLRLFAGLFSKRVGQQILVENRPGANQIIGSKYVVLASADGYTLYYGTAISPHPIFNKENAVDISKNLAPISTIVGNPVFLYTSAKLPVVNWQELLAHAKARPNELNYASPNSPSLTFYVALVARRAPGFSYTTIGYKGSGEAVLGLVNGDAQFTVGNIAAALGQLQAGTVRPMFVMAAKRSPLVPNMPTAAESGVNLNATIYASLWAPKQTPADIIQLLNRNAVAVTRLPEFGKRLTEAGNIPVGDTPEECMQALQDEIRIFTEAAALMNYSPP